MKKLIKILYVSLLVIQSFQASEQTYLTEAQARARQEESNRIALNKQKLKDDLIAAAEAGDANKVKALLEQGADPSIETKWTEELYADVAKNPEVRRLLKDAINNPKKVMPATTGQRIPAQVAQPAAAVPRPMPQPKAPQIPARVQTAPAVQKPAGKTPGIFITEIINYSNKPSGFAFYPLGSGKSTTIMAKAGSETNPAITRVQMRTAYWLSGAAKKTYKIDDSNPHIIHERFNNTHNELQRAQYDASKIVIQKDGSVELVPLKK
jgi:hypothetical protein